MSSEYNRQQEFDLIWVQGNNVNGGAVNLQTNPEQLARWLDVLCDAAENLDGKT